MLTKRYPAHNAPRRRVVASICTLLALGGLARADVSGRRPQVGFLVPNLPLQDYKSGVRGGWAIIKPELRRLGWIDGQNIACHLRSAEGDWTRIPGLVRELLAIPVDVLVTYGPAIEEAARQTKVIPIVGALGLEPNTKLPANVTGTYDTPSRLSLAKHVSLLKSIAPSISRVAIAYDARLAEFGKLVVQNDAAAADSLGISLIQAPLQSLARPEPDLDAALERGAQGFVMTGTPGTQFPENQLPVHVWARKRRIPVIYEFPSAAKTGGLIAYGFEPDDGHRRLVYFVDRILRGAKPAELPAEEPTRYELVLNLRAAAAIGLTVPIALRIQATSLID